MTNRFTVPPRERMQPPPKPPKRPRFREPMTEARARADAMGDSNRLGFPDGPPRPIRK
jgi:hypothetical protein